MLLLQCTAMRPLTAKTGVRVPSMLIKRNFRIQARELAEAPLAHVIGDRTEAAYWRGDLFEKRRRLMFAWAAQCGVGSPKAGERCHR